MVGDRFGGSGQVGGGLVDNGFKVFGRQGGESRGLGVVEDSGGPGPPCVGVGPSEWGWGSEGVVGGVDPERFPIAGDDPGSCQPLLTAVGVDGDGSEGGSPGRSFCVDAGGEGLHAGVHGGRHLSSRYRPFVGAVGAALGKSVPVFPGCVDMRLREPPVQYRSTVLGVPQVVSPGGVGQGRSSIDPSGVQSAKQRGQAGPRRGAQCRCRDVRSARGGQRGLRFVGAALAEEVLPYREQGGQAGRSFDLVGLDGQGGGLLGRVVAIEDVGQDGERVSQRPVVVGPFGASADHIGTVLRLASGHSHIGAVAAGATGEDHMRDVAAWMVPA